MIEHRLSLLDEASTASEPPVDQIQEWLAANGLDEDGKQLGCLGFFMQNKAKPATGADGAAAAEALAVGVLGLGFWVRGLEF